MRIERLNLNKNNHKISIAPMMDCTDRHFRILMETDQFQSASIYRNDSSSEFDLHQRETYILEFQ